MKPHRSSSAVKGCMLKTIPSVSQDDVIKVRSDENIMCDILRIFSCLPWIISRGALFCTNNILIGCNNQGLSWADAGGPARGWAGPGRPARSGHQFLILWAAAWPGPSNFNLVGRGPARPVEFSEDGPRPGPAHQIFRGWAAARPSPSHSQKFTARPGRSFSPKSRPGPARPITWQRGP